MAKYEYDLLNNADYQKLKQEFSDLEKIVSTQDFKEFIADKCLKELDDIQKYSLASYNGDDIDTDRYQNNHKVKYGSDYILLFNDTTLEQGDMWWVSEKTRANYPNGISIAYIIEYGTGIRGTSQEDWQTDVNGHGAKGWTYRNPNTNNFVWTNGIEGRFIYQKLLDRIDLKFGDWLSEYLEKKGW